MSPDDSIIRITAEEANSPHVDDLLKRQMSLRGEPGVTRDRGRKWYYQNWLVLMCAGSLGAIVAWAILEPYLEDLIYFQGAITAVDPEDKLPRRLAEANRILELRTQTRGSLVIRDQKIHLVAGARELLPDGTQERLDPESLEPGETVGVYVEHHPGWEQDVTLGYYVVRSPPPEPAWRADLTLARLSSRSEAATLLYFAVVAGMVGLFIGAGDGLVCRLPRRAVVCGLVGLVVGLVGGLVSSMVAGVIYTPLNELAMRQSDEIFGSLSTFGFLIQMIGRSLAWCVAGMAMGLGQGIALRSRRLLVYGLLGGVLGGLLGGLLFDPIDLILLGNDKPSAHWSRLVGLAVIGASVGALIGVVELLARDAWLRMTQGPLTGKEFLLFKDVMSVGASPRCDLYLFNDPQVAEQHAVIRAIGEECEIEARPQAGSLLLNNRPVRRARLRHGDNVTLGNTSFVFQQRKS
jgi:hypothetical protein